ncbi:hypothetical protein DH2020_016044 [Rehmannia glutinosa]|uniref:CCHC-type domain-containing protein n=1 Tax=Rehmannia glutinosa TaxID=99300 RepID=A0ABR0WUD1_REHGL
MRVISPGYSKSWLCVGDFNEILRLHEKQGGNLKSFQQMDQFRQVLTDNGLHDLGYSGNRFTWSTGQGNENNILERLDRALAMESWRDDHFDYQVIHLPRIHSDHAPLSITLDATNRRVINHAWTDPINTNWHEKIQNCTQPLTEWDKTKFGNVRKRMANLEKKIELLQTLPQTDKVIQECKDTMLMLDEARHLAEIIWLQRSHIFWYRDRDTNTSFFHHKATQRHKRNNIDRVKMEDDNWVEDEKDIHQTFRNYFIDLFKYVASNNLDRIDARSDKLIGVNGISKTENVSPELSLGAKVCDFIDPTTKIWRADLIRQYFQPHDADHILGIMAWRIWHARNNWYFDSKPVDIHQVIQEAQRYLLAYKVHQQNTTKTTQSRDTNECWSTPEKGQLKLNTDAATFTDGYVGFGFVIRDCKAGFCKLHVECDSNALIDGINGKSIPETHGDLLIDDIRYAVHETQCESFCFMSRNANKLADGLAKFITCGVEELILFGKVPGSLENLLPSDIGPVHCWCYVEPDTPSQNMVSNIVERLTRFALTTAEKEEIALGERDILRSKDGCYRSLFGRIFGRKIAQKFLQVSDVLIPVGNNPRWRFIKILVEVDLEKPLLRGTHIKLGEEAIWVEFKYENLQGFCFYCGKVGHMERGCLTKKEDINTNSINEGQFRVRLCAPEPIQNRGPSRNFNVMEKGPLSQFPNHTTPGVENKNKGIPETSHSKEQCEHPGTEEPSAKITTTLRETVNLDHFHQENQNPVEKEQITQPPLHLALVVPDIPTDVSMFDVAGSNKDRIEKEKNALIEGACLGKSDLGSSYEGPNAERIHPPHLITTIGSTCKGISAYVWKEGRLYVACWLVNPQGSNMATQASIREKHSSNGGRSW